MSSASRGARAAARCLQQPGRIQSRRYASHGDSHGASSSAYNIPGGASSGNEGFGRGFYLSLAAVPFFYVGYNLATSQDNVVKRFVEGYSKKKAEIESKNNALHDTMLQQAIEDRFLLKATPRSEAGPPVRYPEHLNAGSPLNVVAGEGTTDLSTLIKHYEEKAKKQEEIRAARLKQ